MNHNLLQYRVAKGNPLGLSNIDSRQKGRLSEFIGRNLTEAHVGPSGVALYFSGGAVLSYRFPSPSVELVSGKSRQVIYRKNRDDNLVISDTDSGFTITQPTKVICATSIREVQMAWKLEEGTLKMPPSLLEAGKIIEIKPAIVVPILELTSSPSGEHMLYRIKLTGAGAITMKDVSGRPEDDFVQANILSLEIASSQDPKITMMLGGRTCPVEVSP